MKHDRYPWADSGGRWVQPFLRSGLVTLAPEFEEAILADESLPVVEFYGRLQEGKITAQGTHEFLKEQGETFLLRRSWDQFEEWREWFRREGDPLYLILLVCYQHVVSS